MVSMLVFLGCNSTKVQNDSEKVRLVVIDPQHFHAALVQKYDNANIDSTVHLFADSNKTVVGYTDLIAQYNGRSEKPTKWNVVSYFGPDFMTKAFEGNTGNVVVLAGDNQQKIEYISKAIENGKDVFADKPLVIDLEGYNKLSTLLNQENSTNSLIYDIMSERYDVKNQIVKALIGNSVFSGGILVEKDKPAIQFRSVHHFIKEVSGKPLVRPALFFSTKKQGEGLVDVTTHYIDLVQWILASEQTIDIKKDVILDKSLRWKTSLTKDQFAKATTLLDYPSFLSSDVVDDVLSVYSNGQLDYAFKGVPISIAVKWNVESSDGKGDQFSAVFNTQNVIIEIKPDENGKASVFVSTLSIDSNFESKLQSALDSINDLKGLTFVKEGGKYKIVIPDNLYLSHEEHFAKVLNQFLVYKANKSMPEWEKSFILAKYYLTTQALHQANTIDHESF